MIDLLIQQRTEEKTLVTKKNIKKGTVILQLDGSRTSSPTQYSVQIGHELHIDIPKQFTQKNEVYYWAFLNHSCQPNAFFKNMQLIALTDISENKEITFNYNTTELEMSNPFLCNCKQDHCINNVEGYKFLTPHQKQSIIEHTASYLY